MLKAFIGFDNGVTGTIGIITPEETLFYETPNFSEKSYQRSVDRSITRIDRKGLSDILDPFIKDCVIFMERPMIDARRFQASVSAIRAFEATLCVLEDFGKKMSDLTIIDSRNWQKLYLPEGIKGTKELKGASMVEGIKHFPEHEELIRKHGDADGLFISMFAKKTFK